MSTVPASASVHAPEPISDVLERLRRELLRRDFLYEYPPDFRAGVDEAFRGIARVLDQDGAGR